MRRVLPCVAVMTLCAGCDDEFSKYDHPVAATAIDLSNVTPAQPATYFEYRQQNASWGAPVVVDVLGSTGVKCADAADTNECIARFDALGTDDNLGFQPGGHPGDHFKYLAINRGDDIELVTHSGTMAVFLGAITSQEEALLTVASHDYWWSADNKHEGGILAVDGGYEVICTRLTSMCAPLESTGYKLLVRHSGDVRTLEEWTIRYDEDGCM